MLLPVRTFRSIRNRHRMPAKRELPATPVCIVTLLTSSVHEIPRLARPRVQVADTLAAESRALCVPNCHSELGLLFLGGIPIVLSGLIVAGAAVLVIAVAGFVLLLLVIRPSIQVARARRALRDELGAD